MGQEQKKPEEKKPEEEKKAAAEESPKNEEKKAEGEESKEPPPPQEIVLKVFMHCEGCARKVRRCLKGFPGVEDVQTDCKTHKVVVKGEKADPLKVKERVQSKSHRAVELVSPIPPPADEKPPEDNNVEAPEKTKEPPQVITVVLGVHMHCEACAQEIRKRIQRMQGVESAEADLKGSQVTVKGVFEAPKLVEFVHKRTGKHAAIVKVVEPEMKQEEAKQGKEDKKAEDGAEKEAEKGEQDGKDKKEGGSGGGGAQEIPPPPPPPAEAEQQKQGEDQKVEMQKNEVYYYHPHNYEQLQYSQRYVQELYAYPPQIFSDENPNACSVM